ncbi:MAG: bifunctional aconitate hydratase 2/2-methylisocitrate dehydratase [Aeromonas sp.]
MLEAYYRESAERAALGIAPKALTAEHVAEVVRGCQAPPAGQAQELYRLLSECVPPGVDEAAYVKASFLTALTTRAAHSPLISPAQAVALLGQMQGGYNVAPLIALLSHTELASAAADALSHTLLMFDAFHDVEHLSQAGNEHARRVLERWAAGEWFLARPALAEKITVTVLKVDGETNTDDLSPATDAWSRPDIPLHARAMLKNPRAGITPDVPGEAGPLTLIAQLKQKGFPLAYVGDVVGTGSSRKSATNSLLWFIGQPIAHMPNKCSGGVVLGGKIAPIFFNTLEDAGALPLEVDVTSLALGEVIDIYPYRGEICRHGTSDVLASFSLKTPVLADEVRAGGRINLIIGRGLTDKARQSLKLPASDLFVRPASPSARAGGFTLAQKMVGRACGVAGVRPGTYCEPKMSTVGSQDTTGPMTRDELKDLACLGFSADLVVQSFCHTAAYPKPVDIETHHTLPDFIMNRGGVSLRPGDGVIHSWMNRMLLPDAVGTGGDSHTRFPLGISFPAGSGLVAFAAATGVMPLDMPESVLVRFHGELQPGMTLRDLVHAIPYVAIAQGHLTVVKAGKKNIFSGRILEIEGLPDLKVEQAFELADASAERSAAGCTIKLNPEPISEYLHSNIVLLQWLLAEGYGDARSIARRIEAMQAWLAKPELLAADSDAEYAAVIEIDLATLTEPILCAPNDPDDARLLSTVAGAPIDEVFIGSCMTNIGHFRAAGHVLSTAKAPLKTRLWIAPPTKMDRVQLISEGVYRTFERVGARLELPGCSLCMGNQARVADGARVVSTSTRNFPNRLGKDADVYLASAELAAVTAELGRIPTLAEYHAAAAGLARVADDTYRYLNFDQLPHYVEKAQQAADLAILRVKA